MFTTLFFIRRKFFKIAFWASAALNLITWFLTLQALFPPTIIPGGLGLKDKFEFFSLHYTIYFGVDWIGKWYLMFVFSAGGFLCLALNFLLAKRLYKEIPLLSHFLAGATPFIEFLLLISLRLIILLNA